jgi:hypothetical protein
MSFLKIELDEQKLKKETDRNVIGATTDTLVRQLSFTPTDSDTWFLDGVNGLDTNSGTLASPFKTLNHALAAIVSSGKAQIHILGDTNPYECGLTYNQYNYPCKIQSALGKQPSIYLKPYASSALIPNVLTSGWVHTLEVGYGKAYMVANNTNIYSYDGSSMTTTPISGCLFNMVKKCRTRWGTSSDEIATLYAYNAKPNVYPNGYDRLYVLDNLGVWTKLYLPYGDLSINMTSIKDFTLYNYNGSIYKALFIKDDKTIWGMNAFITNPPYSLADMIAITHEDIINCIAFFRNSVYVGCNDGVYSKPEYDLTNGNFTLKTSWYQIDYIPIKNITCLQPYYYWDNDLQTLWHEDDCLYIGNNEGIVYEYNANKQRYMQICKVTGDVTSICRKRIGNLSDVILIGVKDRNVIYRFDYDTKELTSFNIDSNTFAGCIKHYQTTSDNWNVVGRVSNLADGFFYLKRGYTTLGATYINAGYAHNERFRVNYNLLLNGIIVEPNDINPKFSGFDITQNSLTLECYYTTIRNISGLISSTHTGLTVKLINCFIENTFNGITPNKTYDMKYNVVDNATANITISDCIFKDVRNLPIHGLVYGTINHILIYNSSTGITYINSDTTKALSILGSIFLCNSNTAIKSLSEKAIVGASCFYFNKTNMDNCTEHPTHDNIYQSPLLKSIDNDDYHLNLIETGSKFDSPCKKDISLSVWFGGEFYSSNGYLNLYNECGVLFSNNLFGMLSIDYSNNNTSDVILTFEESDDNTTFTAIEGSFIALAETGTQGNLVFPIVTKPYIRIVITCSSWDADFSFDNCYVFYRDIGVMNTTREDDPDYNTSFSMRFSANPKSSLDNPKKSDESLATNILGGNNLLARPRQYAKLTFEFENESHFIESELHDLKILFDLHKSIFKITMSDEHYNSLTKLSGTSKTLALTQIKSNITARAFFRDQDYDVTDYMPVITDSTQAWEKNLWKGWWVKIVHSALTYYKRILFNDETTLWLEDEEGTFTTTITITNYDISYFRGILPTTNLELKQDIFHTYIPDDNNKGSTIDKLEFIEVD